VTAPVSVDYNFVLNNPTLNVNVLKQTFAIVCSFMVSDIASTNSLRLIRISLDFPLMNKVDSIYTTCPSLVEAHSYGSFPPIPNNISPDKD